MSVTPFSTDTSDTDNDALPDSWEQEHFGGLEYGPSDDPDGDGSSNYQEYIDGTDPMKSDEDTNGINEWLVDNWLSLTMAAVIFLALALIIAIFIFRRSRKPEVVFEPDTRVNGAEKDEKVIECQPDSDDEDEDQAEMADTPDGENALEDLKDYKTIAETVPEPEIIDQELLDVEQEALSEELPSDFKLDKEQMRKDLDEKLKNKEITQDAYREMISVLDEKS